MKTQELMAAVAVTAATFAMAAQADTIITGGEARITLTADVEGLALGTNWADNAAGQPEYYNHIRSSPGYEYTYISRRDGSIRTWTASESSGSNYISETESQLKLASSTLYLEALDADGNPIETFAPSVWILPQRGADADLFSQELRDINWVPTSDPLVWEDFENPGTTHTFTAAEVAYLTEAVDDLRLCCAHTLGNWEINTALMTIDGVIDGIVDRDINGDKVVDAADEFHMFDLVVTAEANVYDMALTTTLAQYLNYGFTSPAFADSTDFDAKWAGPSGGLGFSGGDVIGQIAFTFTTATVPVPAALPLLAGGIGVMGLAKRRRNRKAA